MAATHGLRIGILGSRVIFCLARLAWPAWRALALWLRNWAGHRSAFRVWRNTHNRPLAYQNSFRPGDTGGRKTVAQAPPKERKAKIVAHPAMAAA